ncbi:hypothetical protein AVEN_5544-1 [Araneus ventricosus]|uniref:Uncharacterized protein n=1 Tax=Araneus ventricosus TaxID=182803 RepID=A0A4Y2DWT4_ARAVE|nr:hypothetical protein AVEN_5544-1 [Araneus ventricosus]
MCFVARRMNELNDRYLLHSSTFRYDTVLAIGEKQMPVTCVLIQTKRCKKLAWIGSSLSPSLSHTHILGPTFFYAPVSPLPSGKLTTWPVRHWSPSPSSIRLANSHLAIKQCTEADYGWIAKWIAILTKKSRDTLN